MSRTDPAARPDSSPSPVLRVGLLGLGRMGRAVRDALEERGHEVALVVDPSWGPDPGPGRAIRLEPGLLDGVDVVIDVSTGPAVPGHAEACARSGTPLVVGATGWDDDRPGVEERARNAGIGLLVAPNFSLGVNLFFRMVRHAARLVNAADPRDAALHEAHHRHKADHPGGTARRLAEILVEELDGKTGWTTELPAGSPFDPQVLQVGVTRAGEIPGTHRVVLDGPADTLELVHTARSREGFARGAVAAAEWIHGRTGVFTMEDLLDDLTGSTPDAPPA
ncbi:MAG: 4-hydroxy-tetrahydrodipicolinate reductase [Gemmatimonadales bacterium]|nr:MAG: 4-hydroxy-tetrahydrodipicolinate reductase [Gemmatimonadales bacterium]